jgi:hypothetical protein
MAKMDFPLPPLEQVPTQTGLSPEQLELYSAMATRDLHLMGTLGATPPPQLSTPKGSTGSSAPSSAANSSNQALTVALQAGRVSALVDSDGCHADEVLLPRLPEKEFADVSKRFVHIQWRSVSEIFDYLGAILRYNERGTSQPAPFQFEITPDPIVKSSPSTVSPSSAILFAVYKNVRGRLYINLDGDFYVVRDTDPNSPGMDYTMPILSMLSTLVNEASQPNAISTSTPLRLLPIP